MCACTAVNIRKALIGDIGLLVACDTRFLLDLASLFTAVVQISSSSINHHPSGKRAGTDRASLVLFQI